MVVLYSWDVSPPCRAVLMASKVLDIELDIKEINVLKGDQFQPSFLEINPQHTIPTMDDGGLIIPNSHAINIYLVEKYGTNDLLYPKDIAIRASVNHKLFFDEGTAFSLLRTLVTNIVVGNKDILEKNKENAAAMYKLVDTFLTNNQWIAGSQVTIADFHLVSTITTLNVLIPYESKIHPNLTAWIKRCQNLSYYDINEKGLEGFTTFINQLLSL